MQTYHNAFIPQTILFFSLGAYFSIHDVNPLKLVSENKKWFIVSCALFAIADIGMHTIYGTAMNLQAHRLALLFNIPILLLLADACTSKGYSNRLLPNAAFIVFAVHYPIVVVLRKICAAKFATASDTTHIMLYFVCIIIATVASMLIYLILAKYFPKLKNLLSGNR
jgi:peptidoglycan/LPS O-acetylase OafA/YrhL